VGGGYTQWGAALGYFLAAAEVLLRQVLTVPLLLTLASNESRLPSPFTSVPSTLLVYGPTTTLWPPAKLPRPSLKRTLA
jgi:hypothetical protein